MKVAVLAFASARGPVGGEGNWRQMCLLLSYPVDVRKETFRKHTKIFFLMSSNI